MTKLLKICVLGFMALGFVACDGSPSCKSGEVKDEVIKKVKSMYPNSNPKLTNITTANSLKEEKVGAQMLECKADVSNLDEDILSVNYNVLKLGDKVQVSTSVESAVAKLRSEIANAQRTIVAKVFADNVNTKSPTAPKGKSWGEWIMEVNKFDANKWQVSANGVILKDCGGENPLISIDSKTGIMHFKPSTLPSDNALCKGLSNSYKSKSGSGDKKIPLASSGTVEFR